MAVSNGLALITSLFKVFSGEKPYVVQIIEKGKFNLNNKTSPHLPITELNFTEKGRGEARRERSGRHSQGPAEDFEGPHTGDNYRSDLFQNNPLA